jgi:hypothetical protein
MAKRKHPAAITLGRRGGKVTSATKAAAARANGHKGGRPPKHASEYRSPALRTKMVTVCYFEQYDISTDEIVRSKRPATLAAIKWARGEPIQSTAFAIDERELDGNGFRKREA